MQFANCAVLSVVLCIYINCKYLFLERLCSSAEAGIVLNLFNSEHTERCILVKKVYREKCKKYGHFNNSIVNVL